jgi:NYN domain
LQDEIKSDTPKNGRRKHLWPDFRKTKMPDSPPPTSPPSPVRVIAYVDGFNFYYGLRTAKFKRFYWLDFMALAGNLLRSDQLLAGAKYFTSRISGPTAGDTSPAAIALRDSHQRQALYLDALATTRLRIIEGHFLSKRGQCHGCGNTWPLYEEKMTDVNIATELLTDAFTDQFDTAMIISGDSDLVPPVRAIRQHFPTKRVIIAFPPKRFSHALSVAAHGHVYIEAHTLGKSLLPDEITRPNGFILKRPAVWQ